MLLAALPLAGTAVGQVSGGPLIVLIGPPLSGKTTQISLLEKSYGIPTIATDDLIQAHASDLQPFVMPGQTLRDMRYDPVDQPLPAQQARLHEHCEGHRARRLPRHRPPVSGSGQDHRRLRLQTGGPDATRDCPTARSASARRRPTAPRTVRRKSSSGSRNTTGSSMRSASISRTRRSRRSMPASRWIRCRNRWTGSCRPPASCPRRTELITAPAIGVAVEILGAPAPPLDVECVALAARPLISMRTAVFPPPRGAGPTR